MTSLDALKLFVPLASCGGGSGTGASAAYERDEEDVGQRAPEPAALDEVDVEDVAFAREVAGGCGVGLEGLRDWGVGAEVVGRLEGWAEVGEGGAEEEG
jgi:hypothetical protein